MAKLPKDAERKQWRDLGTTLSFRERAQMLEKVRLVKDLGYEQIESLARRMQAVELSKGTVVFEEGDRDCYLCLIVQGRISIWKEDSARRSKRLTYINVGQSFGEMSLLDEEPRSATAVADTDAQLLVLTEDDFRTLGNDSPVLAFQLLARIARLVSLRLRLTSGALAEYLATDEAPTRARTTATAGVKKNPVV